MDKKINEKKIIANYINKKFNDYQMADEYGKRKIISDVNISIAQIKQSCDMTDDIEKINSLLFELNCFYTLRNKCNSYVKILVKENQKKVNATGWNYKRAFATILIFSTLMTAGLFKVGEEYYNMTKENQNKYLKSQQLQADYIIKNGTPQDASDVTFLRDSIDEQLNGKEKAR
ncbi:MAG: hypothetical protein RR847_02730 [Bacilli bacterium]